MITVQTHGFKELAEKLQAMPDKAMANYIRKAEYQAAILVRDAARELAPIHNEPNPATRSKRMSIKQIERQVKKLDKAGISEENREIAIYELLKGSRKDWNQTRTPGTLKKGIIIGQLRKRNRSMFDSINFIQLSVGLAKRAYYGLWIETGFIHYSTKGKSTHIPARPFLRPAFDTQTENLINRFKNALYDLIKEMEHHA